MNTHTPGPWDISKIGNNYDQFSVYGPDGQNVVNTCEGTANAHLIAAAPELLEAAKHAAMEWRLHGQLTDSCRILEAAIRKAEGREGE